MAFKGLIYTEDGKALLAGTQLGDHISINKVSIGDGMASNVDHSLMHDLSNRLYDVIPVMHRKGDQVFLDVDITSMDQSGYYFREIGIIATVSGKEVLLVYDNAGIDAEYIVPMESGISYEKRLRFVLIISNQIDVTVPITGSLYALQADLTATQELFSVHKHDDCYYTETETDEKIEVIDSRITNIETNGVVTGDTIPVGGGFISHDDTVPTGYAVEVPPFSNPNLLINGDFQVWQLGTSFDGKVGTQYTADRWLCTIPVGNNIKVSDDGTSLCIKKENVNQTIVRQFIEINNYNKKFYINRAVTLAINYHSTVAMEITIGLGDQRSNVQLVKGNNDIVVTFDITPSDITTRGDTQLVLDCLIFNNLDAIGTVSIRWAKLEHGEIATPFIPRSYAEELMLCQRYYSKERVLASVVYEYSKRSVIANFTYSEKRIAPTFTFLAAATYKYTGTPMVAKEATVNYVHNQSASCFFVFADDMQNATQSIWCDIVIDAEIR